MYKKTLLSLAVASSVALTGCFEDAKENTNAGARAKIQDSQFEGKTWPVFNPVTSELPVPNDLIFDSEAGDGSFSVSIPPGEENNPVLNALNNVSGASTVAPAVIRFNGNIDETTVDSQAFLPASDPRNTTGGPIPNPFQNVFLLETEYPSEEPVRGLSAQEPPTLPVALTAKLANGASLTSAEREAVSELIGTDLEPLTATQRQQAAGGYLVDIAGTPRFDHDVVKLDGTSALRIRPNQPLDPLKRYIVVVTDEVKDENGDPISASPTYSKLSEEDAPELGEPLATVRSLVNNLWEASAASYFAVNNGSREAGGLDPLSTDDIALTYSFTTSADEDVLAYIANPAEWIEDQVRRSVTTKAAKAAVEGGASGFTAVRDAVNTAVANFTPSDLDDGLSVCDGSGTPFVCVGNALKTSLNSNGIEFPEPAARSISFDSTTDAVQQSVLLQSFLPPSDGSGSQDDTPQGPSGDVNVHQGSITLPYHLKPATANDGSPIRTSSWEPDASLASAVASATGFTIPQADPDTSSVINYNFPFPEAQEEIEVPLLAMSSNDLPASDIASGTNVDKVVIYQHGITTDRSAALAFGAALVEGYDVATGGAGELVVLAIDQPLHGVSPVSTEERLELAGTLLSNISDALNTEDLRTAVVEGDQTTLETAFSNAGVPNPTTTAQLFISTNSRAGSTIAGIDPVYEDAGINSDGTTERHFGYSANEANAPAEMNFDESAAFGSSGSLFINLTNFLNNRDNLRQGSLDLMNLRATVANLGINAADVHFVGHSLGTLNGGAFAGAAARSEVSSLQLGSTHLITPVAGVTRMLENSPSFAPSILGGLQASGLSQGDADLETFLNVAQHTLDTVDPINFASDLSGTNILLSQINGDRTVINGADERYSDNVATYDTAPLNLTFPNGLMVDSPAAPLSGSEPLQNLVGANNTGTGGQALPAITRFTEGEHGTPVFPLPVTAEEGDVLKTREIAQGGETIVNSTNAGLVFSEMVTQTLQMVGGSTSVNGGTAESGAGATVIQPD